MFLRSKIQEMIPRRRSRSMNGASAQRSHISDQLASSSAIPCDSDSRGGGGAGGSKSATARVLFASPRLLHSSSLPTGSVFAKDPAPDADSETAFSLSPTSVLDAAAAFASGSDVVGKRRPWLEGLHGLTDALDSDQQERGVLAATSPAVRAQAPPLVRSCSLDRRVEFGVKNKSSWLPLRCGGRESPTRAPADPGEMEPSSEDYTCVISRGPNPRTVHIFGDRVVEGAGLADASGTESSPRPINLPARGDRGFLSL
ncbi:FCS-Like Zinc finger 8-like isoform X2 [Phragmites australis]|nr:FCS-Like Zinc finger 8-like isoform X2 [Phragmites australis]